MCSISPEDTVTSRLRYWSVTSPETLAFLFVTPGGERHAYTRKEFFSMSRRAATWLWKQGVRKRDVILFLMSNSPEQALLSVGAMLLGATVILGRMENRDGSDIVPVLTLGDVTAVAVDRADVLAGLANLVPDISLDQIKVTSEAFPSLRHVIFCHRRHVSSQVVLLDEIANEEEVEPEEVNPDDTVTIFLTSGSTGQSKLVPHTHRLVLEMGQQQCEVYGCGTGDTVFGSNFFGWVTGYPANYFVAGVTRVVPYFKGSSSHDVAKFLLDLMREVRATHVTTMTVIAKAFLNCPDLLTFDVARRPRCLILAGSPVRKDVAGLLGTLTSELRVSYGSTEAGFNLCKVYTDPNKVQSFNCGKPSRAVRVKVVDENLREVAPNTKGDLMIKHNGFFPGYLRQPAATAAATPEEGWFRPGDLAYVNEEGDVFVEGRHTEIITVGVWLMYPQPLETRLMECPGVHDVAVVAIPDETFGSRPCACVVQDPRPEADRVVPEDVLRTCEDFFRGNFLREFNMESALIRDCLLFDKFPVNPNGKVQRSKIRAEARERLFFQKEL